MFDVINRYSQVDAPANNSDIYGDTGRYGLSFGKKIL